MLLDTGLAAASASAQHIEAESLKVVPLGNSHMNEVLAFLNKRPASTFMMEGLVRDNGLESQLNRGTFYGTRDGQGRLEGVSLAGEITMLEAHTEAALAALARQTQKVQDIYMIIGEQAQVGRFWDYYAQAGQALRLYCRELLFELRGRDDAHEPGLKLRQATCDELEQLMAIHAQLALAESGVNPLEVDPEGFKQRCLRRIQQGRTWVHSDANRLVFKADVVSATPETIYLEGVYVSPEERRKGYGVRCVSALSRHLLTQTNSICVLLNEQNQAAQALYRKAGYQACGIYDTVFLRKRTKGVGFC
jgi:predicted GNAT family acetyltransferase